MDVLRRLKKRVVEQVAQKLQQVGAVARRQVHLRAAGAQHLAVARADAAVEALRRAQALAAHGRLRKGHAAERVDAGEREAGDLALGVDDADAGAALGQALGRLRRVGPGMGDDAAGEGKKGQVLHGGGKGTI